MFLSLFTAHGVHHQEREVITGPFLKWSRVHVGASRGCTGPGYLRTDDPDSPGCPQGGGDDGWRGNPGGEMGFVSKA